MDTFPTDHPVRATEWVWPDFYMYLHNHFAQFRWDFELAAPVAASVPLFVTADKAYKLWVNGAYVCRGPARGYQSHWPVDEVDVAPHLRPGRNWVSVEAYQPGCSTFQYLHANYAGLLVATPDAALRRAMADGARAMRRSPGHRRQTARYSYQIDFQEHLDLRLDDRRWVTHPDPPRGWVPDQFPPAAQKMNGVPFGRAPWDDVEPRGIPLLRERLIAVSLPTVHATGACGPGYEQVENVSWHWVEEARQITDWRDAAGLRATRRDGDGVTFTLPPTGVGRLHAVVVPVGEYVAGAVEVRATGAAGGEILDVQHDQFFRDGRPHFVTPGDGCVVAMGNRLVLRPGDDNAHEFYHVLGFGAVTLIARDLTRPLTVTLRVRTAGYPFAMRGAFECSDETLNAIHAACRRTQQLCALDAYMDTPWREQAQWWGDARVQAWNTFYLDGDARLLARGIRSLGGQDVAGLTPGHAPTSSYWCVLPDFALTWVLTLWDHHWQTGETALFAELCPRAERVLEYFDSPAARHGSGLLKHDPRFWLFEDWSTLPKGHVPTFLNLWYVLAVRHLAKLYGLIDRADDARRHAARADAHLELIERHVLDRGHGHLRPALDDDLRPNGEPSVHDHTLALMLGDLRPDLHDGWTRRFILPYLRREPLPGAVPSAFWAAYVLEQAIARGHAADAVAFIRARWAPMLSTGTTWEGFDWAEESGGSACHAWTAHPCYHLVNALAGVTQTAAGWRAIRVSPAVVAGIDRAAARVPTPRGDVDVEWRRDGNTVHGRLVVPSGMTATLALPGVPPTDAGPGEHPLRFDVAAGPGPSSSSS